jgi:REP element-mobilizing transposase RayT
MPQSLSRVLIHTAFSTKERAPLLSDTELRGETHAYLGGIAKQLGCDPIRVGGVADHVHLLTVLPRTMTIADFVKEVKRVSSNWIKERGGIHAKFQWQSGYGVFSVSPADVDQMVRYIEDQELHHRATGFQDEYRALLREQGIEFDERYVWD